MPYALHKMTSPFLKDCIIFRIFVIKIIAFVLRLCLQELYPVSDL